MDCRVSYPSVFEKSPKSLIGEKFVQALAASFKIESSSFLQVTWTNIKPRMSLKFDQFLLAIAE